MQRSQLAAHVKERLRVSASVYDSEVEALVSAALRDLERSGVSTELIESLDPLVVEAVVLFCKALFGLDNAEAEHYHKSYRLMLATMCNDRVDYRN